MSKQPDMRELLRKMGIELYSLRSQITGLGNVHNRIAASIYSTDDEQIVKLYDEHGWHHEIRVKRECPLIKEVERWLK